MPIPQATQEAISAAVSAGIEAGRLLAMQTPADVYKATERRLSALPILHLKVLDDQRQLALLRAEGSLERVAQLTRLQTAKTQLTPGEMLAILLRELETAILLDQQEIETMERALEVIQGDPYYSVISGRFFDELSDREIANAIPCNPATVRKNRGRLIRRLAVRLYGAQAIASGSITVTGDEFTGNDI